MNNSKPVQPEILLTDTVIDRLRKNREYYEHLKGWGAVNLPFVEVLKKEDFKTYDEYNVWQKDYLKFLAAYDPNKKHLIRKFLHSTKKVIGPNGIFKIAIVFFLFVFLYLFYDYSSSIKKQSESVNIGRYVPISESFGRLSYYSIMDTETGCVYDIDGKLINKFEKK